MTQTFTSEGWACACAVSFTVVAPPLRLQRKLRWVPRPVLSQGVSAFLPDYVFVLHFFHKVSLLPVILMEYIRLSPSDGYCVTFYAPLSALSFGETLQPPISNDESTCCSRVNLNLYYPLG